MAEEDIPMEEGGEDNKELEVAPALIAIHPSQKSLAVAVGSDLRVYDLHEGCALSLVDESCKSYHKDSIRAIQYGVNGQLFVSAGDDKLVKIWSSNSWHCIGTICCEKRVSAIAISNDGLYVCFADKFGVVWLINLEEKDGIFSLVNEKAVPMLSHYCSIITSLEFSPSGQYIVSADRDFKIRVTMAPKRPLGGAHEIHCFCLGHSEFVSCLDFVSSPDCQEGFLVSGSGDSTVRLWDITTGSLLDTCEVGAKAGLLESNEKEEGNFYAVTDLSAVPECTTIAVAIQSFKGIILLSCNISVKSLSITKMISLSGEAFIPTCLGISMSENVLWMIMGISKLQGLDCSSLIRIRAISGIKQSNEEEPIVLEDSEVPGGKKLLDKLQGSISIQENAYLAASEALKKAMSSLLIKKQYSVVNREIRKRTRNDRKLKQ
ncbi:hypothetical protein SAY86_010098 [Trapa natans]|uniref:tRNA (guanine-N(7)-)-methyltransferase non-catalytic subunit n=1 Tax=Trapa natans TaxID=22666 RepID=A0AAN7L2X1_TRANT|nr:hypothetical protein SAY86_010098 [Trapa natans]